jgi:rare lipoprotein A
VVPFLLIQSDPEASASPTLGDQHDHHAPAPPHVLASSGVRPPKAGPVTDLGAVSPDPVPSTTTTPTTSTEATSQPTTPAQAISDHVVSAVIPATTTTTTTTTTTAPPVVTSAPGTSETGQVTYYAHPAGTCASPWLPFGTVVRITNPANGQSVSCVVNDREADRARAIDLATATFAEIAPLSQGVIDAELSW